MLMGGYPPFSFTLTVVPFMFNFDIDSIIIYILKNDQEDLISCVH